MDHRKLFEDLLLLPNLVTLSRLVWTVLFVVTLGTMWQYLFLTLSFFVDGLDGRLARSRHEHTRTGVLLDPLVGKISILVMVLAVVPRTGISLNYLALFLLFPAFTVVGAIILVTLPRLGKDIGWISPRPKGKMVSVLQFMALATLLLSWTSIATMVLWLIGLLSLAAGIEYAAIFFDRLNLPVTRSPYFVVVPPLLGLIVFSSVVFLFLQAELAAFLDLLGMV